MKKNIIFYLFLLSLSFVCIDFKSTTFAEASIFSIEVIAQISTIENGEYEDKGNYTPDTGTFRADYSVFNETGSLKFSGMAIFENEDVSQSLTYQWKTSTGEIVSDSEELILYKSPSSPDVPLILIGELKYVLIVTDLASNTANQKVITVIITDTNSECFMQTFSPNIPSEVNQSTDALSFHAKLPVVNGAVINWFLKTPSSTRFNLIQQNSSIYNFEPAGIINNLNGYGTYQVMAIGYNKNNNNYYQSEVFCINAVPKTTIITDENKSDYEISSKVINNTKANIEAFTYTLSNSHTLDPEKIYWYLGDSRAARGSSFIYEPTDTTKYRVTAKYQKTDGTMLVLATLEQQPKSTGVEIMLLYLLGGILVITIIFSISVIVTNKKRDVIW